MSAMESGPIELRVAVLPRCLINPPHGEAKAGAMSAPTLGAVVPALMDLGLGWIATALKKAAADETAQVSGQVFENLYVTDSGQTLTLNPALGCLLAVWYQAGAAAPADDDIARLLKAEGLIPGDATVSGVFEAMIRPTADGTAFFLDARHFDIRVFVGERHKDQRAFVVTVAIVVPSADAEGRTIALGHINFGALRAGASCVPVGQALDGFPRFRSNLMPWSTISPASKQAYERDRAGGAAGGRPYMPVTIGITVSETADGNRFLAKLAEVLSALAKSL